MIGTVGRASDTVIALDPDSATQLAAAPSPGAPGAAQQWSAVVDENSKFSQGGGKGYQYGAPGGTEKDDQFVRSSMYGSFLSGGFGGHVYGAEGNPAAPPPAR